ncbi:MAG: hypothetical protein AVDCRST_MAG93-5815 [uncultured Chloroflexia bacterium]|uniref:histidine kinase n=1 Tax=uncultured Chloroflexia bacterium TaxID=1672391 RepID=A0A6J4L5C3_9CHLR|nr:MAG: hypothetical protein AVDCRST_MAG93-5815 [uncultured Chloroflexia bacterium]
MKLQRKLGLHYIKVVVAFLLLFMAAALLISLIFGGFQTTVFGAWIIWPGISHNNDAFWFLAFVLSFTGIFFLIALNYGKRMSAPIFYLLNWLDQLAQGNYAAPSLPGERSRSAGGFFRLYGELTEKMMQLTDRLRQNEIQRKELEALRREWTSGVTHDLKTPLSYIQGYAAMLLSDEHDWTDEERGQFISIMQEKATHMQHLIDELNDSLRFEKGTIRLACKRVDMISFLRKLVEDAQQQPVARHYRFHFQSDAQTLLYPFDEHLMKRALLNFLMNAVLHNPAGTVITVSVHCEAGLIVAISDNGKGMSETEQKHLFERYYRGISTDTPVDGTGLGMAIAKQLIVAHEGVIRIQSAIGQGTSITISLPLSENAKQA